MHTAGVLRVGILGGIAAVAVATAVSPIAAAAGSSGGSADGSVSGSLAGSVGGSFGEPIGPDAITVMQIPANGIAVSGLVVPFPYNGTVNAETSDVPGQTVFSAPLSDEVCSANGFGFRSIRIGYTNVATGDAGSVDVHPCTTFMGSPLDRVTAHTGSGPVVFTVSIVGQPSLPGFGGFIAP
ncbi:hypothetical protein SAMN05444580_104111 [Rhodococcus tukisamuensis]|uniref:MspA protein n=2 Tax=Rhodococcus tukisamuensis TaxID=168276 RepID=A0A1G6U8Q5_9NOCA|nr:hypothetical protein SAMN05444580_104111 [Rhodococcus tukisamuensis]